MSGLPIRRGLYRAWPPVVSSLSRSPGMTSHPVWLMIYTPATSSLSSSYSTSINPRIISHQIFVLSNKLFHSGQKRKKEIVRETAGLPHAWPAIISSLYCTRDEEVGMAARDRSRNGVASSTNAASIVRGLPSSHPSIGPDHTL
jgi:hypothetical protein